MFGIVTGFGRCLELMGNLGNTEQEFRASTSTGGRCGGEGVVGIDWGMVKGRDMTRHVPTLQTDR